MLTRSKSRKAHDELDWRAVRKIYGEIGKRKDLEGEIIASPFHLFAVETLRNRYRLRYPAGIPTDVFVFAEGEPLRREVTKIGGLPYWPASRPWPRSRKGFPYLFIAQFCFADSRDLFKRLPGDVLLLFIPSQKEEEDFFGSLCGRLHFEWMQRGEGRLIRESEIPERESLYQPPRLYGVIHRTADYPKSEKRARHLEVRGEYRLSVLEATKIGGVARFIQPVARKERRLLCQLCSVQPAPDLPYPWVNRKKRMTVDFDANGIYSNEFTFGDMGSLYIFLNRDGSVSTEGQCY